MYLVKLEFLCVEFRASNNGITGVTYSTSPAGKVEKSEAGWPCDLIWWYQALAGASHQIVHVTDMWIFCVQRVNGMRRLQGPELNMYHVSMESCRETQEAQATLAVRDVV